MANENEAPQPIEEVIQGLAINIAAEDTDLVALLELRTHGYTDTVSPERADVLEVYNHNFLREEIKHDYSLDDMDVERAICKALQTIAGRRPNVE